MSQQKQQRLIPFEPIEIAYLSRLVKSLNLSKENVPMSNGKFSSVKLKSAERFNSTDISILQREFLKRFDSKLKFETNKQGIIFVGCLSKV